MLVDPRPYTYEYRKPRFSNPTLYLLPYLSESRNLYQSLYNKNPQYTNDYFTPRSLHHLDISQKHQRTTKQPQNRYEPNSSDLRDRLTPSYNPYTSSFHQKKTNTNPEYFEPDLRLPNIHQKVQHSRPPSPLHNVQMSYSDNPIKHRQGFERFRIYERQQKPFNIINCHPKQQQTNQLRNFPKLTLEDKLIERGSYHTFTLNRP